MKIIFLDIDGVLNNHNNMCLGVALCPTKCVIMRLLADVCEAKFVISSTWRLHNDCKKQLSMFGIPSTHIHEDWRTTTEHMPLRGAQIELWLKDHPEVTNYVIIDDESDMTEEQLEHHFVKTEFIVGFTHREFMEAKEILDSE